MGRGATSLSDCYPCPPGKYCDTAGIASPSGDCSAGYYCPEGSSSSTPLQYRCSSGYKCPGGTGEPIPCDPGTYQDSSGQSSCLACPPGYYCDPPFSQKLPCKAGYYCPGNDKRYPCPIGIFI